MENVLSIQDPVAFDDSISNYEFHAHQPYTGPNFNQNDEIRIAVQYQDVPVLPSRSYLHVVGKLHKTDGSVPAGTKLVDMGICHLIDDIRYELNSVEIDRVKNVGITSVLKGLVSLNRDSSLSNAGWYDETADNKGRFDICLPLKYALGFIEDYPRIILNARHELVIRLTNSHLSAIIQTNQGTAANPSFEDVKISISKVEWLMPYVTLSDVYKIRLLNYLQKGKPIAMSFRGWELHEWPLVSKARINNWLVKTSNQLEKPRYIIIGFQTNRRNQKDKSSSEFDHCKISNLRVYLNSQYYPYNGLNCDFTANQFSVAYENYLNFYYSYYNTRNENRVAMLTKKEFLKNSSIFVIDCSKQKESLKNAPVDVRVEFESSENMPDNTSAYCLIIHDRVIEYNPMNGDVKKIA